MNEVANYFKSRRAGFYIACVAAVFALIAAIDYGAHYSHSVYLNAWAVALPILGIAAYCGLSVLKMTRPFAALALGLLEFVAFLIFVNASYLYLSEVFFGGLSGIANIDPNYVVIVVFMLFSVILSNVAIYLKQGEEV